MVNERRDDTRYQGTTSKFWDSRRNIVLLVGAIVTITVGLLNISFFNIKELYLFVGIILTILVVLGFQSLDGWLNLKIQTEINKSRQHQNGALVPAEISREDIHEKAYTSYVKVFGLAHENLVLHGTLNEDGSMSVIRRSSTRAYIAGIGAIDHYLMSDASQGTITVGKVDCLSSPFKTLSPRIAKATADSLTLVVEISPPLMEGEEIEILIPDITPPGAISKTYQEMLDRKKQNPYECFHWEITRPTRHLEMKVLIPENLAPERAEPDVWYGPSRIRCEQEFYRIINSFKREQAGTLYEELSLDVNFPIPGMRYVIKWIPPGRNETTVGRR